MSKIIELNKLRDQTDLKIIGKDNIPKDYPSVIISNHNRLLDIIYLPLAFDEDIISLVSARLVFKQDLERLYYLRKYLNAFPIEAHGGKIYSELGLKNASRFLDKGISTNIFPEGAYIDDQEHVYKGRTGAARVLFNTLQRGNYAYFLPVSIDIKSNSELDTYKPSKDDKVIITVNEPILPNSYYKSFCTADLPEERNIVLHDMTDRGMKQIAESLGREYVDEYIELNPKGNVMFPDGEKIDAIEAQKEELIQKYDKHLKTLRLTLSKDICLNNSKN